MGWGKRGHDEWWEQGEGRGGAVTGGVVKGQAVCRWLGHSVFRGIVNRKVFTLTKVNTVNSKRHIQISLQRTCEDLYMEKYTRNKSCRANYQYPISIPKLAVIPDLL